MASVYVPSSSSSESGESSTSGQEETRVLPDDPDTDSDPEEVGDEGIIAVWMFEPELTEDDLVDEMVRGVELEDKAEDWRRFCTPLDIDRWCVSFFCFETNLGPNQRPSSMTQPVVQCVSLPFFI